MSLTPEKAMYTGDHESLDPEARQEVGAAFFQLLQGMMTVDPDFGPETDVQDYGRRSHETTVDASAPWQRHQSESATQASVALYALGCTALPFSLAASGVLMTRGTDPSVPSDLSSLKMPPDDGTAVG